MQSTSLRKRAARAKVALLSIVVGWALLSLWGLTLLWRYESMPGDSAAAPVQWPSASAIPRHEHAPTLVMFAHPRCPCTRASIAELERLVTTVGASLRPVVVFLKPDSVDAGWEQTDLWRTAAAIPGAQVIGDRNGEEARRFGVETSGHALLYDDVGQLLYSGGITAARGHQGDNAGRSALVRLLSQESTDDRALPVFGCPLSLQCIP